MICVIGWDSTENKLVWLRSNPYSFPLSLGINSEMINKIIKKIKSTFEMEVELAAIPLYPKIAAIIAIIKNATDQINTLIPC